MKIANITLAMVFCISCYAQNYQFNLVSYNSLRYSPTNIDARHPQLRMVLGDLQPDLLCVQELSGSAASQMYLDSVLNFDSTTYSMATFINSNDLDVNLFYKTNKFGFISTQSYTTTLRDIYHFQVVPTSLMDTLHVFGLHLKASPGTTNQLRRKDEVDVLRQVTDAFAPGTHFLVCGDFNIYKSSEPAYARLLEDTPGNDGHFVDQFSLTGTWNNASYAMYHTQSPRSNAFNGGASGGMDDRFDMILISETLNDTLGLHYVQGSMYPYGNDGQHYNMSINDLPTNSAVGQVMADALYFVSDHIPVVASFAFKAPPVSGVSLEEAEVETVGVSLNAEGVFIENPENRKLEMSIFSMDGRRLRVETITHSKDVNLRSGLYLVTLRGVEGDFYFSKLVSR